MKKVFFLCVAIMVLAGCQSQSVIGDTVSVEGGAYQNVIPTELVTMFKSKDLLLVNVHIPFVGNIPGTDLSIPYNELQQNLSELHADKNAKIVVYCSSGRMSQIAAEELISLGYTNVWNLEGGMTDWQQAGFELEK